MKEPGADGPRPRGYGRIAGEASRAAGSVRTLRGWFVACTVIFLASSVVLLPMSRAEIGEVPFLVSVVLGAVLVGFFATAAAFVERNPIAWSLAGAIVLSLVTLLSFLGGGIPFVLLIASVIAWTVVPKAFQLRRLMAENPDLRVMKRFQGEAVEEAPARPGAELRKMRRPKDSGAARKGIPLLAIPVAGLLALAVPLLLSSKPVPMEPDAKSDELSESEAAYFRSIVESGDRQAVPARETPDEAVRRFLVAWDSSTNGGVSILALFPKEGRAGAARSFEEDLRSLGWTFKRPMLRLVSLDEPVDTTLTGRFKADDGGLVQCRWRDWGGGWNLESLELRKP